MITLIVCGTVLFVVLVTVIVFVACTVRRRRSGKQAELDKILGNDASNTYEELCRQHMLKKGNEKVEHMPTPPQRSLFGGAKIFGSRDTAPKKMQQSSPDGSQLNSTSSW